MKGLRFLGLLPCALFAWGSDASCQTADLDQLNTVQKAAVEIAQIQQKNGANGAFAAITQCYQRELATAKTLTPGIETCIAQDIIVSKITAAFSQAFLKGGTLPPGARDPGLVMKEMVARVTGTFARFGTPQSDAIAFNQLVMKQGLEAYTRAAFPQ